MPFSGPKKKVYSEEELYEYAVGALARRMRTVAELKRLLRQKVEIDTEFGQTLVELIIRKLKDQGYLNDAKYAAAYSSFRRDNEKFGRMRVVTDLKVKGVHGDVIDQAVSAAFDEPIGGLKIMAASGWFAVRPSGTEDVYKIYAESFQDQGHLDAIVDEAQRIVAAALG